MLIFAIPSKSLQIRLANISSNWRYPHLSALGHESLRSVANRRPGRAAKNRGWNRRIPSVKLPSDRRLFDNSKSYRTPKADPLGERSRYTATRIAADWDRGARRAGRLTPCSLPLPPAQNLASWKVQRLTSINLASSKKHVAFSPGRFTDAAKQAKFERPPYDARHRRRQQVFSATLRQPLVNS
jgi:hypothetical protein